MVTGVGLSAPASCAAIRCAITNFQDTRFTDSDGEWIVGSTVPLEKTSWGRSKLIKMAAVTIKECLQENADIDPERTPLLLCLAEPSRPGRVIKDDRQLFLDLCEELGMAFHEESRIIAEGHVSIATAFKVARTLIHERGLSHVIAAATDSLLVASSLDHYEEREMLSTSANSDGFIPGEAAAALVLESPAGKPGSMLCCQGLGFGIEVAHVASGEPLKAEGLSSAIKEALADAEMDESVLAFKIVDISGGLYYFKEASLAFSRIDRTRRKEFDIWQPADCIGEVGAAIGFIMTGVVKAACEKGYSKGSVILAHFGNDDGKRSSMILTWK
jgi:3-oxoacyl-[acyl-carrier-protein] synthase-1